MYISRNAKLKLKDSVDEEDATDTINKFNEMLEFYKRFKVLEI
jgi:hypothetical protein